MKIIRNAKASKQLALLKFISNAIRNGKVVAIPTDTAYGLAANASDIGAVKKVFSIKQRPFTKPLSVFLSSVEEIYSYCVVNEYQRLIIDRLLPGPYTIILKAKKDSLPKDLIIYRGTLGVRVPEFLFPRILVELLGAPITATSANIHGFDPIYSSEKLKDLSVDIIVDYGELPKRDVSTIIDLTQVPKMIVLREGQVKVETIEKLLRHLDIDIEIK